MRGRGIRNDTISMVFRLKDGGETSIAVFLRVPSLDLNIHTLPMSSARSLSFLLRNDVCTLDSREQVESHPDDSGGKGT